MSSELTDLHMGYQIQSIPKSSGYHNDYDAEGTDVKCSFQLVCEHDKLRWEHQSSDYLLLRIADNHGLFVLQEHGNQSVFLWRGTLGGLQLLLRYSPNRYCELDNVGQPGPELPGGRSHVL
jgi:hypothetical protein